MFNGCLTLKRAPLNTLKNNQTLFLRVAFAKPSGVGFNGSTHVAALLGKTVRNCSIILGFVIALRYNGGVALCWCCISMRACFWFVLFII